eukprot:TRINITY_DN3222_c0_g2_i1.p2 TRINITY_DN3222_c0_g2~~TRINITY_DN3222_c0_g2_i1.p2  ORF type:complete len:325 (-),score=76.76 TRINITY_DN3222_c0_g2_i1:2482-3456(-)
MTDFLQSFKRIQIQLKKRVLRKPNYDEASTMLHDLKNQMKREECWPYAAFCSLAAARCELAMKRRFDAALSMEEAGAFLWDWELEAAKLKAHSFQEMVPLAMDCYQQATDIYVKENQKALAAGLLNEMGLALRCLKMYEQAAHAFDRACRLTEPDTPFVALSYLTHCPECCIYSGEFEKAIEVLDHVVALTQRLQTYEEGASEQDRGAFMPDHVRIHAYTLQVLLYLYRREQSRARDTVQLMLPFVPTDAPRSVVDVLEDITDAVQQRDLLLVEELRSDCLPMFDALEYRLFSFLAQDLMSSWNALAASPSEASTLPEDETDRL